MQLLLTVRRLVIWSFWTLGMLGAVYDHIKPTNVHLVDSNIGPGVKLCTFLYYCTLYMTFIMILFFYNNFHSYYEASQVWAEIKRTINKTCWYWNWFIFVFAFFNEFFYFVFLYVNVRYFLNTLWIFPSFLQYGQGVPTSGVLWSSCILKLSPSWITASRCSSSGVEEDKSRARGMHQSFG